MFKIFGPILALLIAATASNAAEYNYIDNGDYYYINDWGAENRRVVVVRKLGDGNVKVRDLATGESSTVQASRLLTQSELQSEETENALVGTAVTLTVFVCLLSPETCEKK